MLEASARHDQRHQRAEWTDKKAEAEQWSLFCQNRNWDQKQINVAQLQRQLSPLVEATHICRDDVKFGVGGQAYLYTKKPSSVTQHTTEMIIAFVRSLFLCTSRLATIRIRRKNTNTMKNSGQNGRMIQNPDMFSHFL